MKKKKFDLYSYIILKNSKYSKIKVYKLNSLVLNSILVLKKI